MLVAVFKDLSLNIDQILTEQHEMLYGTVYSRKLYTNKFSSLNCILIFAGKFLMSDTKNRFYYFN